MFRYFVAAVSFLTRLPVGRWIAVSTQEVGKSSRWFPLVGALLGVVYVLTWRLLSVIFPPAVVALLIVVIEALLTGALHLDGLADMADGFGGGRTREDVLRIMRDHAIGAYGAISLILVVGLKVASLVALEEKQRVAMYLLIAPVLSRWSTVILNNALPYARRSESEGVPASDSVNDFVGRTELAVATSTALLISSAVVQWFVIPCSVVVLGVSAVIGFISWRRIDGVTGDTLGANTQCCEVAVLLVGLAMR